MGYAIRPDEPVSAEIQRVVSEQVSTALDAIEEEDPHEAVHETRKCCKRIRGTFRLVRDATPAYREENRFYRDVARTLAPVRDAHVLIETLDGPLESTADEETMATCRAVLVERREALLVAVDFDSLLAETVDRLVAGRERAIDLDAEGFDAVADGIKRTYRRGRKRMDAAAADPSPEAFHEWRKRAKYHRYHVNLLSPCWPKPLAARERACHDLTDLLGDTHDLAVFRATIREEDLFEESVRAALDDDAADRQEALREQAFPLGARLYTEPPKKFVARMRGYWETASG